MKSNSDLPILLAIFVVIVTNRAVSLFIFLLFLGQRPFKILDNARLLFLHLSS